MLGILKYKKKVVSKLSGGQQQRVSIARALVKAPNIILADEPTGNLDEENTLKTMMILKNISKECLVIVVTHEKRIAKFFADRIIQVSDGKIVSDKVNNATAYERSDDSNIYLKEYEQEIIDDKYAEFKLYHKKDDIPEKIRLESCIYKISRKMTLSLQMPKTVSRYLTRKDRHLMHKMLIILNIIFQGLTKRKMQGFHSGRYGIWRWQILRH